MIVKERTIYNFHLTEANCTDKLDTLLNKIQNNVIKYTIKYQFVIKYRSFRNGILINMIVSERNKDKQPYMRS